MEEEMKRGGGGGKKGAKLPKADYSSSSSRSYGDGSNSGISSGGGGYGSSGGSGGGSSAASAQGRQHRSENNTQSRQRAMSPSRQLSSIPEGRTEGDGDYSNVYPEAAERQLGSALNTAKTATAPPPTAAAHFQGNTAFAVVHGVGRDENQNKTSWRSVVQTNLNDKIEAGNPKDGATTASKDSNPNQRAGFNMMQEEKVKMGMMGGAFKRGGKDDDKGPKEEKKKKDDKKKSGDKGASKVGPPEKSTKGGSPDKPSRSHSQVRAAPPQPPPAVQVTSPEAKSVRPAVVTLPRQRRVGRVEVARMASVTEQVIDRVQQRITLNPALPRGARRASLPVPIVDPFLSPREMRGAA